MTNVPVISTNLNSILEAHLDPVWIRRTTKEDVKTNQKKKKKLVKEPHFNH